MAIAFRDLLHRVVDIVNALIQTGQTPGEATQRAIIIGVLNDLGVKNRDGIFELTAEELRSANDRGLYELVPDDVPDWAVREFVFVWQPPHTVDGCRISFRTLGPWHCGDIEFHAGAPDA